MFLVFFNWSIRDWIFSLFQIVFGALVFLSVTDDSCAESIGSSLLGGQVLLLIDILIAIYPVVLLAIK
jgi:hypothetical protein